MRLIYFIPKHNAVSSVYQLHMYKQFFYTGKQNKVGPEPDQDSIYLPCIVFDVFWVAEQISIDNCWIFNKMQTWGENRSLTSLERLQLYNLKLLLLPFDKNWILSCGRLEVMPEVGGDQICYNWRRALARNVTLA